MPTVLGYIVQYFNEDDFTLYHGPMKLHKEYKDAFAKAEELYKGYLQSHNEIYEGPFEVAKPTKQQAHDQGSVVVFRSADMLIWIDIVVD